ncbi:hypothetical protein CROQUDRAFT_98850 [Cronartium quercuum f. sp. fusiforme G11]|uniref:Uncharacterized protein n=1 Tax=Cronartium quercuum f. sp. fusiforme G11 TaxID=708437 RepID=A0A9P6T6U1_9BASI|nr:hypothetical protein CROQUDRAFT_98850 [Cronartium quercuum f. sp. fusiforme G11]
MDLRGGWRVKPQTLNCTSHRLRYTTAPNPHSTLSHSPIAPPFTNRSALHRSHSPSPIVSPYTECFALHRWFRPTAIASRTCLRMDWWKHSGLSSPIASEV